MPTKPYDVTTKDLLHAIPPTWMDFSGSAPPVARST